MDKRTARLGMAGSAVAALGVLATGSAKAIGWNDPIVAGASVGIVIIAVAVLAFLAFGMAQIFPGAKKGGRVFGLLLAGVVAVMILAVAVTPATVVTPGDNPATFQVLAVAATHGNYTQATKTISVVLDVNTSAPSLNNSATHILLNFTVQRTDQGVNLLDARTITGSYAPVSMTDAVTGLSFSVARPNTDGRPNVNWTLVDGAGAVATASRTLTAQMGLVPYETGNIAVNIVWNPSAIGISQVQANDIVNLGTVVIGGETFIIQGLIHAVWT